VGLTVGNMWMVTQLLAIVIVGQKVAGMKIVNFSDLESDFFELKEFEEVGIVKQILEDVRINGDDAIRKYTRKYDGLSLENFEINGEEIKAAYKKVDTKTIAVLKEAAGNISFFAGEQFKIFRDFEVRIEGNSVGQRVVPLKRAGCYVPGGRYPLPSTVLMCVIPAKIAGVSEVIVCSPKITPVMLVAADIAGADRIFNIGGAQAIGAMAFGTGSVPKVDKIVGPGNKYVTAAKKEVYGRVGIDFLAGPSEVFIIADETGDPRFIAADLLAQAEHDPDARSELVTTSKELALEVENQVKTQISVLKTKKVIELALKNGLIITADSLDECITLANLRAPEHLEIFVKDPELVVPKLNNYGSLFIGEFSAEVFGDYCTGTNHVLPTNGAACYTGGLSVKDFLKILTYQNIEKETSSRFVELASELAGLEGLEAHKKAAEARKIDSRRF